MTLPSTLRQGNSTGAWKTTPISRRGPVMGMPFSSASPSLCGSSPARILSRVDLPHPDGPTTAMNSPSAIAKEMLLSASTPAAPRPYLSDSPRTEMTEPGAVGCLISAWAFKLPSASLAPSPGTAQPRMSHRGPHSASLSTPDCRRDQMTSWEHPNGEQEVVCAAMAARWERGAPAITGGAGACDRKQPSPDGDAHDPAQPPDG